MLLNAVEKVLMNNPIRAQIQRRIEAGCLVDLGGRVDGGRVLEVGCGRGVGVQVILDRFGASQVDAFDLDIEMVDRARARLSENRDRVRLWVGDVNRIEAPDAYYDAVFDFGIIHHVPDWRGALADIFRVLRPGGRLFAEEVLAGFLEHRAVRTLLRHPSEDRFDHDEFVAALAKVGFVDTATRTLWGQFGWYVTTRPELPG